MNQDWNRYAPWLRLHAVLAGGGCHLLLLLMPSNLPPPEALDLAAVKLTGASTLPHSPKQSPSGTPRALPSCDIPPQPSEGNSKRKLCAPGSPPGWMMGPTGPKLMVSLTKTNSSFGLPKAGYNAQLMLVCASVLSRALSGCLAGWLVPCQSVIYQYGLPKARQVQ